MLSFRVYDYTSDIEKRTNEMISIHQVGNRDLGRYYTLLKYALKEVALTENEAMCIVDSLNGTMFLDNTIRLLYATIEDAFKFENTHLKYNINADELIEKLKKASNGYLFALVDAVELFWENKEDIELIEKLKKVGII